MSKIRANIGGWRAVVGSLLLALAWAAPASANQGQQGQQGRHGKISDEARNQAKKKLSTSRGPARINLVAKPDLIAPSNRIVSMRAGSYLDLTYPERRVAADPTQSSVVEHFVRSGISMATHMVSGAAALTLEQEPSLNPGTVKARLMLSARKAAVGDPFATGAGALDILAALHATGQVADAPSPLSAADSATGLISFENTRVLWLNPSFSLTALWSSAVVWSTATPLDAALLTSSGVVLPDISANALLWPDSTLAASATLWPDSTLWSEAVL
jgi:serine protease AprX